MTHLLQVNLHWSLRSISLAPWISGWQHCCCWIPLCSCLRWMAYGSCPCRWWGLRLTAWWWSLRACVPLKRAKGDTEHSVSSSLATAAMVFCWRTTFFRRGCLPAYFPHWHEHCLDSLQTEQSVIDGSLLLLWRTRGEGRSCIVSHTLLLLHHLFILMNDGCRGVVAHAIIVFTVCAVRMNACWRCRLERLWVKCLLRVVMMVCICLPRVLSP